jgi:hypothetical protein
MTFRGSSGPTGVPYRRDGGATGQAFCSHVRWDSERPAQRGSLIACGPLREHGPSRQDALELRSIEEASSQLEVAGHPHPSVQVGRVGRPLGGLGPVTGTVTLEEHSGRRKRRASAAVTTSLLARGKDPPRSRYPFEQMLAAILEMQPGSAHKVNDST